MKTTRFANGMWPSSVTAMFDSPTRTFSQNLKQGHIAASGDRRTPNKTTFCKRLSIALVLFVGALSSVAQTNTQTREWIGLYTNGPVTFQMFRQTTITTRTQAVRLPQWVLTNPAYASNRISQRIHTNTYSYTNLAFERFTPDSLQHLVWTNFLAHTNGRDMVIWSQRSHAAGWPTNPPIAKWNTNSLIWGMKGVTAISPCWMGEGAAGQVPLTALTRRHAYTRGHGMGDDGFNTNNIGRKAWFVAKDNSLVEAIVKRQVTRAAASTNGEHRDYTILMFDRDLPESIEPMTVTSIEAMTKHYLIRNYPSYPMERAAPNPIFQTEQEGRVSSSIAPLTVNTWKGGDSGSPNMIPLPGELVFFSGRSTSGPTEAMQRDIDELCRLEKLDAAKYQLRWAELSKYPAY